MISSVKIGGMVFTVELVDNLDDKAGALGSTLQGNSAIYLDSKRAGISELVHEMIHQASWLQGYNLTEADVLRTEFIIMAILRDNPKLLSLIQKSFNSK